MKKKDNMTVAIQGFGNVGYWFARKCVENGIKVVAISNKYGAVYNPKGLDIYSCRKSLDSTDHLHWGSGTRIDRDSVLEMDVDVVVPAAMENAITKDNVDRIKAPVVLELANGPVSNAAHSVLSESGRIVIPDLLANAGGVVVSYFEWLQNRHAEEWDYDKVDRNLRQKMEYATDRVISLSDTHKVSLKTATYILALKRLADANECLGNKGYFTKG